MTDAFWTPDAIIRGDADDHLEDVIREVAKLPPLHLYTIDDVAAEPQRDEPDDGPAYVRIHPIAD